MSCWECVEDTVDGVKHPHLVEGVQLEDVKKRVSTVEDRNIKESFIDKSKNIS